MSGRTVTFGRATARRLICFALTVLLAAVLAAVLVRSAPGFGMDERQLDPRLNEDSIRAIHGERGADVGVPQYFWKYLSGLSRFDLGRSVSLGRPVRDLIGERLQLTLNSVAFGLALSWGIGMATAVALGVIGWRVLDTGAGALAGALLCLPAAAVGLFCFYLGAGPALAIAAIVLPRILRYLSGITRTARMCPHVLAARARGVGGLRLDGRHIWLPAAPELLGLVAVSVSMALGAAIPVEALCDSPGIGQLAWKAALARDLPVLVNLTVLIAGVNALCNLFADGARALLERGA